MVKNLSQKVFLYILQKKRMAWMHISYLESMKTIDNLTYIDGCLNPKIELRQNLRCQKSKILLRKSSCSSCRHNFLKRDTTSLNSQITEIVNSIDQNKWKQLDRKEEIRLKCSCWTNIHLSNGEAPYLPSILLYWRANHPVLRVNINLVTFNLLQRIHY